MSSVNQEKFLLWDFSKTEKELVKIVYKKDAPYSQKEIVSRDLLTDVSGQIFGDPTYTGQIEQVAEGLSRKGFFKIGIAISREGIKIQKIYRTDKGRELYKQLMGEVR